MIEEAKKIVDKLSVDSDELWKIPMVPAHKAKVLLDKEGIAYVKVVFDDGDFWTVRNPFNGMLLTSKEAERFPQFTWVPLTDL